MADDKPTERPFVELLPMSNEDIERMNALDDAMWRGWARQVKNGTWPKGVAIPESLKHLAPKPEDEKPVEQPPELTAADEAALDIAWAKARQRQQDQRKHGK